MAESDFDAPALIKSLERFPTCLEPLINSIREDLARWKPPSGSWSILEIVCHLRDEEIDDFRARLRMTLDEPERPWPSIDPVRAALDRQYNQSDLNVALDEFLSERRASLLWLRQLGAPRWHQFHEHPRLGTLHAGDLLAAWAAHDWLHLRQICKRLYESTVQHAGPFNTDYAGPWTA